MWYYREHFPRSRPRQAKGGIKAQSKRGGFGQSWWAQRWIAVLESFNIGARLGRGRSYARSGQVLSIDIEKGKVKAQVQGSRPKPYSITIQVKALSTAQWKELAQALAREVLFAAKLLAGEMPQDIERVFNDAGLSLFPEKLRDLTTNCSCPDDSNPCKHIAAVYYLLGEEFDRDPFLIFKLRGLTRDELLKLLEGGEKPGRKRTKDRAVAGPPQTPSESLAVGVQALACPGPSTLEQAEASTPTAEQAKAWTPTAEPLSADAASFWSAGDLPEDFFGEVEAPRVPAALPKRLGSFPFWRGQTRFLDALEPIYQRASQRGLDVFLGEYKHG